MNQFLIKYGAPPCAMWGLARRSVLFDLLEYYIYIISFVYFTVCSYNFQILKVLSKPLLTMQSSSALTSTLVT